MTAVVQRLAERAPPKEKAHPEDAGGPQGEAFDIEDNDAAEGNYKRRVLTWLNQVEADPNTTSTVFRLAFVISQHISSEKGYAWPSQKILGERLGISPRQVNNLVKVLEQGGHLHVTVSHGRDRSNEYRLILKKPEEDFRFKPETDFRFQEKTGNPAGENLKSSAQKPEAHFNPYRIIEPDNRTRRETLSSQPHVSAEPKKVSGGSKAEALEVAFEEWYSRFPKKAGKGAARRAYAAARKKASQAELIAGAERYAAERRDQDPKYTKHPTTWLNGEHWADEPAPRRTAAVSGGRQQQLSPGQILANAYIFNGEDDE